MKLSAPIQKPKSKNCLIVSSPAAQFELLDDIADLLKPMHVRMGLTHRV